MRALRTVTLLIALACASTAHADAEKAPPIPAAHVEKMLAFYNELVDESVKHAADCAALATALDGVVTRQINTLNMMWAARRAKKTLPRDVQAKMEQRARELVGALRRCLEDDRVKATFKRMKLPANYKE